MKLLSILIPTIKRHEGFLIDLLAELRLQSIPYEGQVELLIDDSEFDSIGEKRNRLLQRAAGGHVAFFDADDRPSPTYISSNMAGIEKGVDCCSLKGIITFDGKDPQYFEHSIKYKEYKTNPLAQFKDGGIRYERPPLHLNCIRASIAKQFKFPEKNWGEDTDFSLQIRDSGLIKTEHYIGEVLYFYDYISNKNK